MKQPPPYRSIAATLEEVRALRASALVRATETLISLLEHPSGAIRLAAAEALASRVEGKPTTRIEVEGPDTQEQQERATIRALFDHWIATSPTLFAAGLEWAKQVHAGQRLPPPEGLLPPTTEPALSLWRRLLAVSGPVPALVEVVP
jgi:hypothetical protein